ncbi:unnamed protein product [Closterium sp. NIES-64]|nr:unnamed protein product [Closterium sp. NIES-64]
MDGKDPPVPAPVEVTGDSGSAGSGAVLGGAELRGAQRGGAESGGAEREEPEGAESGGAEPAREEPGGPEPGGAASRGTAPPCAERGGAGSGGESPEGSETAVTRSSLNSRLRPRVPLTSQQLHDWYARRQRRASSPQGSTAGGSSVGVIGAGSGAGPLPAGGAGVAGPGGACTGGTGAAGAGGGVSEGSAAGGTAVGDPGTGGAGSGGAALGGAGAAGGARAAGGTGAAGGAGAAGATGAAEGTGPAGGAGAAEGAGAARGAGAAEGAGAAGAGDTAQPRLFFDPPFPSSLPPPDSVLRQSGRFRAEHPTVTRLLAAVVADPSFESAAVSSVVAELVELAAACCLNYVSSLVTESESVCPPFVRGESALGTDVLEDRQEDLECLAAAAPHLVPMLLAPEGDPDARDIPTPRSYAEAIEGPYSSHWQTAMDVEMASWKSTGTYVDEVPPPGANIVSGMSIFRVKQPPHSPPIFKARYVARGFSQREGVDFFQTFSPTPNMTTLRVLLHVAAQRDYELLSLDFSTPFLQGSPHEEIWLRRPPGFTGSFPLGTQWSLRRPFYGLRQAPREWHDTLRTTLAALRFAPSTAEPSLFLHTDTSLPPFYILVYVDDLVFATADTEALALVKSEL